jgi:hypothetical protein
MIEMIEMMMIIEMMMMIELMHMLLHGFAHVADDR